MFSLAESTDCAIDIYESPQVRRLAQSHKSFQHMAGVDVESGVGRYLLQI